MEIAHIRSWVSQGVKQSSGQVLQCNISSYAFNQRLTLAQCGACVDAALYKSTQGAAHITTPSSIQPRATTCAIAIGSVVKR